MTDPRMGWDREESRERMRSALAGVKSARVAQKYDVVDAEIELCRSVYALEKLVEARPDPIITATLALVVGDDAISNTLYREALQQNRLNPDEKSYEWRLLLAARLLNGTDPEQYLKELLECRAQAAAASDQVAVGQVAELLRLAGISEDTK